MGGVEENLRPFIMPLTEECGSSRRTQRAVFTWMKGSMLQPSTGVLLSAAAWLSSPQGQEAEELTRDLESETMTSLPETSYPIFRWVSEGALGQDTLRLRASVSPSAKTKVWTQTVVPSSSHVSRSLMMVLRFNLGSGMGGHQAV